LVHKVVYMPDNFANIVPADWRQLLGLHT